MKKPVAAILCAAVLSALPVQSRGWAQSPPPGAPETAPPLSTMGVPGTPAIDQSKRLDLQIDGIPLPDLIDYLSEQTKANIVLLVPPEVDVQAIRVPTLKLRNVSLQQVLTLLTSIPGVEMSYDINGEGDAAIYVVTVLSGPTKKAAGNFHAVEDRGGEADPNEPMLKVVPFERMILGDNPVERVPDSKERAELLAKRSTEALSLIDQAFTMQPTQQAKPEIRLHDESGTLLVKATPAQLVTINQVLTALELPGPSDGQRELTARQQLLEQEFALKARSFETSLVQHRQQMQLERDRAVAERDQLEAKLRELIVEREQLKAQLGIQEARAKELSALQDAMRKAEGDFGPNAPAVEKLREALKTRAAEPTTQPQ